MSNTKHFRIGEGYLGGFGDGAKPPAQAIECPQPNHATDIWNGSAWEAKPEDPRDHPLNPAQFDAILSALGITIDQIETAIDQLPLSDLEMAFAKAKARKATAYHRGNELFSLLAPIIGISEAAIDAAWLQAKELK